MTAILFDLDGTLLDTGPDMAHALDVLLEEHGQPPLAYETVRPYVSEGSIGLIRLAFGCSPEDREYDGLRRRFLELYESFLTRETCLFDGMDEVLAKLEGDAIRWGIVTNKPAYLTTPLLEQLQLLHRAASVVSGDTLAQRKPHPAPLLHGCRLAGGDPAASVYIGDAERDIEAGRSAGMTTLVATFGYLATEDRPETWGADGMIDRPEDIIDWIH